MSDKRRILFVDDEQFVLDGLQRMLRPLRDGWDMVFVDNGRLALELMEQRPFDVVVSDMRMPGMNGAELLNEIMRRYPRTIRLILSGHADQELIMKCVGSTHQYLSKPCNAGDLQTTIQRAAALDALLQSDSIKKLLTRLERLPSVPTLYGELVALLQRPDTPVEDVAKVVERDPAMTAQMLKLVNSAFFALQRRISNIMEACTYLGVDTIRSLVLSLQTFSQFQSLKLGGVDLEPVWRHSLRTAQAAKRIAQFEGASPQMTDEAFVAGLLHDVGKLILASNCPADYERAVRVARETPAELLDAERTVFGCDHSDVGGYLLGLWGLPVPVVEAIALHHHPGQCLGQTFGPLTAVHAANVLVQERDGPSDLIVQTGLDLSYLQTLDLLDRPDLWRREVASIP